MEKYNILCAKAIKLNLIVNNLNNGNGIVRDKNLLESAIGNVFQSMFGDDLYKSDEEKAFMLFINIARNHPFFDGNKRTAALVCDYYLMENNLELDLDERDKFNLLINILEKHMDLETGLTIFQTLIKPLESINRKHLNDELKEDFIKQVNNIDTFLNTTNNEEDLRNLIKTNFMKNFSSKHHINYVDLIDVYNNEIVNKKIELDNKEITND